MSDLRGFVASLNRFADSIGIGTETAVKKLALQIFTGVVRKTPVDTGRARASWVIGVEQPIDSPDSPDRSFVFRELAKLSEIRPDSVVFISNSVSYIEKLESGTGSRQAPTGMAAVTLAEVERDTRRLMAITLAEVGRNIGRLIE